MDYREKVLYLLLKHNQDSKELKTSINELKKQLDDSNNQISIMSKALNVPEFVDLDLPSGNKWMKCNIGAKKETDYGLYFQFGDTVGYSAEDMKTRATWKNCPGNGGKSTASSTDLYTWGSKYTYDKYKDGIMLLKPCVDAAYVHTNGVARMPISRDSIELKNYTNREFVTNFNGSNINGYKYTSKKDDSKYIFLPASGSIYRGEIDDKTTKLWYNWAGYEEYDSIRAGNMRIVDNDPYIENTFTDRYVGLCIRGILAQ